MSKTLSHNEENEELHEPFVFTSLEICFKKIRLRVFLNLIKIKC